MSERADEISGTALGIVVENYRNSKKFRALTGAISQMRELCALLEERGYTPTVLPDPGQPDIKAAVKDWATGRTAARGRGPAVILWSGHGVLDSWGLRLVLHDTDDAQYGDETYSANLLTEAAVRSGADQMLLLIDTCHAGAGVMESLDTAFGKLSAKNLPRGRSSWLGVLASSRPQEKAEAAGVLLETLTRVLREGPGSEDYRHEWSSRNGQVSGATVIHTVLAQWPEEVGHKPVPAMFGEPRLMFDNPLRKTASEPELVEYLVQASRGAPVDDGGWFFSGRRNVLGQITEWLDARQPGLFLVTGSAGCGKSAVLGRIATLSDPVHRADILEHGALAPEDPDPGEDSVDASLHLRGYTVQQLAEAIARELDLPVPQTPAALIAEVEKKWPAACRDRLPALVLDGLDEAAPDQAYPIVEQLLAPLSRLVCVLLGSRDRPFRPQEELQEPLDEAVSRLLDVRARAFDLDDETDTEKDIRTYCLRRLEARELPPGDAATAAGLIADRASAHTGGFLFARMATDAVIRRFAASGSEGWNWEEAIPSSISAAFTEDLAEGLQRERDGERLPHAAQDLLTALAWSAGKGMPARGVWEAAASALASGGATYGPEDVDWLLNTYGRYVVEDTDGVQAVYRLYHREFIGHLRNTPEESGPAYRVARALVDLLREQTADATMIEAANPYLRGALAAHTAMAGGRGIALVRELVALRENLFRPDLAAALVIKSLSLSQAGRRMDALAPAREAADLYRDLADNDPAVYLPDLAMSLNNLAAAQVEAGDRQGALATTTEATSLRRDLAERNPAAYLPSLAGALNNLATAQGATGDRQGALATITEAADLYRDLAESNPAAYLPDLAMSLNNLSNFQGDTGDRRGALATITEAADLYRDLADNNPAAYLPNLASALNNLATTQSDTGDSRGALATITEAADLYRDLADNNPAAYLPNLAGSLNNLANLQGSTGDRRGALATITEAADLYRDLAESNPAAYLPDLAMSLNNLSNFQGDTGDLQASLATITQAADLYRDLAESNPAAYLPDLAMSLNNLATAQGAAGDLQGALATITEATTLRRDLASTNPAAYLPNLAGALNNLSKFQSATGDLQGALATITEATGLYRDLADDNPAAYLPNLASALNNLTATQGALGDSHGALAASTEATTLYRDLASTNPAAYLPNLAGALNNLSTAQGATGDLQGALATITEATTLYRDLASTNPAAYLPNLAGALNNLATAQGATGDLQGALATITEATTLYRDLASTNPAAYLPNLAMSLNNLANFQGATGDLQGALATITEATTLYRDLASTDPGAYLPNLASALNNLTHVATVQDSLAAYANAERALVAHAEAARYLALRRAAFEVAQADDGIGFRTLILLAHGADTTAFHARHLLRTLSQADPANASQVSALWHDMTGAEPPLWLAIPEAAMELAVDWINCLTWADSRAFWEEHAEDLCSAEVAAALEELALFTQTAEEHLRIAGEAATAGPDIAFRPYLTAELLHTWTGLSTWEESQAYLTRHAAALLHDHALERLGSRLDTADSAVHHALITLARADGVPAAYRHIEDRPSLHDRLQQLLNAPEADPDLLHAIALLELFTHQEHFTGTAHLALAGILAGDPPAPTVWPPAEPADRDRVISEVAVLIGRHPTHAAALSALIQSLLAA
ncbi:tetratricopeptide repeat protein [Streptomyces sp. NBC_00047]|uniref:caspase family protein n=1 Tax=Streptomyces sp. NBC_00047 TaxID=2975627 RepID=UPI0022533E9E|nr:caspase family protein [Streptomyces sp. NBC_00047]MCX5608327.1 tetratricopeptide repeat protein [Streptomyces sp. NBC_00047]